MQTENIEGVVGPNRTRPKTGTDGEIAVMGMEGDVKTIWNPANADEVDNARETFTRMRAKGYLAFRVDPENGNKGDQIREFDASAGKLIMVPPMAGG